MAGELHKELIIIWKLINEIYCTLKIITSSEKKKKVISEWFLVCFILLGGLLKRHLSHSGLSK